MKNLSVLLIIFLNTIVYSQSDFRQMDISEYTALPNHDDLTFLNDDLANVQVVGIGEATHGTKEFNLLYLKMFKYLVEVHNFNTLFLEDEFVPCARLDEYVKCEENCESISVSILHNWPWQTQELNDLIEWIRAYNKSNKANQLSIVGIDVQGSKNMCMGLNSILKEAKLDTVAIQQVAAATKEKEVAKYNQHYNNETLIDAYRAKLDLLSKEHIDKYSKLLEYLNWNRIMNSQPKRWHLRDLGMGKMLLSYLKNRPQTKGMLIAHNGHLFKVNRGKKNEMKNGVLLGGVLDKALGNKYYFMMQEFDKGCFNAYRYNNDGDKNDINSYELTAVCIEESVEKTVGSYLRDSNKEITFIKENDLFKFFEKKYIKYHNIGAVHYPQKKNPNQTSAFFYSEKGHFDACIFHQKSTATSLLKNTK